MKCPKGFICVSNGTTLLYLLVFVIFLIYIVIYIKPIEKTEIPEKPVTKIEREVSVIQPIASSVTTYDDSRFSRSPQPLRNWESIPEFPPRGNIVDIPIQIRTRGLPEQYQSVGIISLDGEGTPLPLYGRRTILSGDRWNYYTKTDQYNPVSVPIYRNRNCIEDIGCNELYTGDKVQIPSIKKEGTVDIYKIDGPKYIYGLI